MKLLRYAILFVLVIASLKANAQDNRVTMWIVNGTVIVPDSLIVDPSTLKLLDFRA